MFFIVSFCFNVKVGLIIVYFLEGNMFEILHLYCLQFFFHFS